MMTNAEFAAIALWCQKNGFLPRGNTSYGKSHEQPQEHGTLTYKYGANNATIGRVATGSGPTSWLHNNSPSGIDGLCGNVWEWVSGMRVMDGEIQVIPDNNAAMGVDENRESTLWKAIMPDGRLVAPGTAGTLKYDSIAAGNANTNQGNLGAMQLSTEVTHPQYTGGSTEEYYAYGQQTFESLGVKSGLVVPEIAKVLGLYPSKPEAGGHQGDYFYCRNYGERLPLRGGCWYDSARAGVLTYFITSASAPLLSICNLMFGNLFKAPIGAFSSGLHSSPEVKKIYKNAILWSLNMLKYNLGQNLSWEKANGRNGFFLATKSI